MTASPNLPHLPVVSQISKHGVLVLHGFGIKVRVDRGHLCAEWGVGLDRHQVRLSRVNHNLKRLVLIGSDGFITLEALRWISAVGASFLMLDRRGKVTVVCGPVAPSDAKLRRAQALALGNGTALKISKEIISQKLAGQELVVRDMLHDPATADAIARFRAELPNAESIDRVRLIESLAAKLYWQSWSEIPIRWPRTDERRVPEHWKRFGSRISPLTHSPRLAVSPANACLNFLYSVLESEARLSAAAMGLDPGIGLLHVDTPSRDSLACDLMEVVRPKVDAFVLDWLQREPFRRSDFWEDRNGNCRLVSAVAIRLSETADTWRRLVSPVAEYCAQELWSSISKPTSRLARQLIATRLTQSRRREVKGSSVPSITLPKPQHRCNCGAAIPSDKKFCSKCAKRATRKNFTDGRKVAKRPEFIAKRANTMRAHREQIGAWQSSASDISRDTYMNLVLPALAHVPKSEIRKALGVSEPYSAWIRSGQRIPHPRHWKALAKLASFLG